MGAASADDMFAAQLRTGEEAACGSSLHFMSEEELEQRSLIDPQDPLELIAPDVQQKIIEQWDLYVKDDEGTITRKEFIEGERQRYGEHEESSPDLDARIESFLGCILETDSADVSWKQYSHAKALLELDIQNLLHTCLTRREVEAAKDVFDSIDVDGSGEIVASEARAYYQTKYKYQVDKNLKSPKEAEREVETSTKRLFHTHGDGKLLIDFACFMIEESKSIILDRLNDFEHKLAMCAPEPAVQIAEGAQVLTELQLEHAKIQFDILDTNGNGTIELSELKKKGPKHFNMDMSKTEFNKLVKRSFKDCDRNEDKSLDFNEFKAMYNFLYVSSLDFDSF